MGVRRDHQSTQHWMPAACALLAVLTATRVGAADIAPLSDAESIELETADDDADVSETAFRALVENARQWTEPVGDAPIGINPDYAALLEDPAAHRGDVFRIEGVLQQRTAMDEPGGPIEEWFIRTADGRPVQVFVIDPRAARPGIRFRDGTPVVVLGRFYKRTEDVDRQGRTQQYPAFVGALPRLASEGRWTAVATPLWIIAALIATLLIVFAILLVAARRARRTPTHVPGTKAQEPIVDDPRPLPDDPAEALAELRRRAGREG